MIRAGKRDVLGVMVDVVDYEAAVEEVVAAASEKRGFALSALAVHGVMTGVLDAEQRYRLNSFDLLVPDGQPVRWALNLLHSARLEKRVYGPALMLALCDRCARDGIPIYLYGSSEPVVNRLRDHLMQRFPGLAIAGVQPSRFRRITAEEKSEIVAEIRASGARLVFVGLGCPRQEIWAYEFRDELAMPVVAVGAAFDFHAGTVPQAPQRLQDAGLEWLYRLAREPRRLWRRYVLLNPLYVAMIAAQRMGLLGLRKRDVRRPQSETGIG